MYAFTAIDPDFKPKGSRDPLGFQPIWSETGRNLIRDLSTVSGNINDFKILCFSKYFFYQIKGQTDERLFVPFFIRLEQIFAYARRRWNNEISFNGSNFISKHFSDENYFISNDQKDCILSNQRTYGIYGKYIRPARDMCMFENEGFNATFENAFKTDEILKVFDKIYNNKKLEIPAFEIQPLAELLKKLTDTEQEFFRNTILLGLTSDHNQKRFYSFLNQHPEWTNLSEFNIFRYIDGVLRVNSNDLLNQPLEEIKNTEKVLAPLSYRFAYLLTRGYWTTKEIREDKILNQTFQSVPFSFKSEVASELNRVLSLTGTDLIDALINRNSIVSKRRNGTPWVEKQNEKYVVYYGDANHDFNLLPEDYWENPYFIQTYVRLFNTIEKQE